MGSETSQKICPNCQAKINGTTVKGPIFFFETLFLYSCGYSLQGFHDVTAEKSLVRATISLEH